MGYARAGFDVVGVDIKPQPHYPFAFVRGDALNPPVDLGAFDAIHASPPCQHYSRATAWVGDRSTHPDLIGPTRDILESAGLPYVMENVEDARRLLREPVMLCGSMFGLPIRRHRYFEAPTLPFALHAACQHHPDDFSHDHGGKQTERVYSDAMGCDWMTVHEAREAIPPAYTEYLGLAVRRAMQYDPEVRRG